MLEDGIVLSDRPGPIFGVAFSPDGKIVAGASGAGTIKLWETNPNGIFTGKLIETLDGNGSEFTALAFTPDHKHLVAVDKSSAIKVWNIGPDGLPSATPAKEWKSTAKKNTIWGIAINNDSQTLATPGSDFGVALWNINTGQLITNLTGHAEAVWDFKFSHNGKMLATVSSDSTVRLWDVQTNTLLRMFTVEHSLPVYSVAFSPDDTVLASSDAQVAGTNNTGVSYIEFWAIDSGRELKSFLAGSDTITTVVFSSSGKYLISGSQDELIKVWEVATAKELEKTPPQSSKVNLLALTSDGKVLASADDNPVPQVKLWQVNFN
jgi:WD40 repeat protein